jgi:hypothetical protein
VKRTNVGAGSLADLEQNLQYCPSDNDSRGGTLMKVLATCYRSRKAPTCDAAKDRRQLGMRMKLM